MTSKVVCGVDAQPAFKKHYHKPAVRHERVFEVEALSCGKVYATQGSCHSNRKKS